MAVDQQKTRLVQKSIKERLISILTAAGWDSPEDWIRIGSLYGTKADPPAIAVTEPQRFGNSFELGNSDLASTYIVDLEAVGVSSSQLTDLMDSVVDNIGSVPIIDFNVAEPHEGGYDATAQTVAQGRLEERISSEVVDSQANEGRITFRLRESGPY